MNITFNNQTATLAKLGLADQLKLTDQMISNYVADFKKQIYGMPLKLCEYAWDQLRAELSKLSVGSAFWQIVLADVRNLAYALFLAAVKVFANYTVDAAIQLIETDPVGVARQIIVDLLSIELGAGS